MNVDRVIADVTNPEGKELLFLSYEQCEELALKLARKLHRDKHSFEAVVGMSRGGWFAAMIVAYELKIEHTGSIALSSYTVDGKHSHIRVVDSVTNKIKKLDREHKGKVLVVDDLVDSGNTARYVREKVLPNCHIGVLHAKPAGQALADTFVKKLRQDV